MRTCDTNRMSKLIETSCLEEVKRNGLLRSSFNHEWIFAAIFVLPWFLVFTHSLVQWEKIFPGNVNSECDIVTSAPLRHWPWPLQICHVVVDFTTSKIEFYIRCSCIRTQIGCYVFISSPNEPYGSTFWVRTFVDYLFFATRHKSHFKRQMAIFSQSVYIIILALWTFYWELEATSRWCMSTRRTERWKLCTPLSDATWWNAKCSHLVCKLMRQNLQMHTQTLLLVCEAGCACALLFGGSNAIRKNSLLSKSMKCGRIPRNVFEMIAAWSEYWTLWALERCQLKRNAHNIHRECSAHSQLRSREQKSVQRRQHCHIRWSQNNTVEWHARSLRSSKKEE